MSAMEEEEVTLEELATICEENQEELADLILKDVPLYSAKTEPVETTIDHTQVAHLLECDVIVTTDITDIAQEETCCSSDCYNAEVTISPESDGSMSNFSPSGRKKCGRTRKVRTPSTLQHMMEKHRHSERKRHHSLNEQLKTICDLIPGANLDNRETKVVMMQRVISYITYLENSVKLLCCQTGGRLRPSWVLLTTNFASYFHDYFKGIENEDYCDDEVLEATENLSRSMQQEDEEAGEGSGGHVLSRKVSSPTVDSTTSDCVVPVMPPAMATAGGGGDQEVMLLSQDSGLAASITGEGELWALCESTITEDVNVPTATVGASNHGDAELFFRSSIDEGVSAVLEISSSTPEDEPLFLGLGEDYKQQESMVDHQARWASNTHVHSVLSPLTSLRQGGYAAPQRKPMGTLYTIQKHVPTVAQRRHKRKQPSPRRSASQDDYLSDKAYLPSWSTVADFSSAAHNPGKDRSSVKAAQRVLPYNIRCNHRFPVQRLQATGAAAKLLIHPFPTPLHFTASFTPPTREPPVMAPEKSSSKLDLRKTSWMNGFMMFSRINRRTFIQAHPGVHTSHISKIMGHAWRNMSKEQQAPYKEKAQLCAKELYKVYTTNQPLLSQSSVSTTTAALAAADAAIATTATVTTATATTTTPDSSLILPLPPVSSLLQE